MSAIAQSCIHTSLFGEVCDTCDGGAIFKILAECIEIASIIIGAMAVIGIIIAGIMYITSAGNVTQQTKAKRRLTEITIGILCYGVLFAFAEFLIPGGIVRSTLDSSTTSCPGGTSTVIVDDEDNEVDPEPSSELANYSILEPSSDGILRGIIRGAASSTTKYPPCAKGTKTEMIDGYCYAKTETRAIEYVTYACNKYNSCQRATSKWGNKCSDVARINAAEIMYKYKYRLKHDTNKSLRGGAIAHAQKISAKYKKADHLLLCKNSKTSSYNYVYDAGSTTGGNYVPRGYHLHEKDKIGNSDSREGFKLFVKEVVKQLMKGKPVTVAMGAKSLGKWNGNTAYNRHFVTIVGVSGFVNNFNVDQVEVIFEDGRCMNGGYDSKQHKYRMEPYDQPHIYLNGKEVRFKYIDPWGAYMGTTGTYGARVWRYGYGTTSATSGWHIYTYK